ncbi:MAG: hypothetical protein WCF95_03720 [bacterium]
MSFDVNPSEWRPHVSTNRAQATDNDGRGASAGGGGFGNSAFESPEHLLNDDEVVFSSKEKDIDEKMQEDFSNLFKVAIRFFKKLLNKLLGIKFC